MWSAATELAAIWSAAVLAGACAFAYRRPLPQLPTALSLAHLLPFWDGGADGSRRRRRRHRAKAASDPAVSSPLQQEHACPDDTDDARCSGASSPLVVELADADDEAHDDDARADDAQITASAAVDLYDPVPYRPEEVMDFSKPTDASPASSASPCASDAEEESRLCVVCMEAPRSHACVPCGHRCLCSSAACTSRLTRCPLCRMEVERVMKVWE